MRSFKSTVAAAAGQVINPAMNVRALQNRVTPETEDVFNDSFWEVPCNRTISLPSLLTTGLSTQVVHFCAGIASRCQCSGQRERTLVCGWTMRILPEAFARVGHSGNKVQHADGHSEPDRELW